MSRLPGWQHSVLERAVAALQRGRLGHALLVCGGEGLGKRAVAEALVARLLCTAAAGAEACGECRGCRLRAAGSHPDLYRVSFEERDDGKLRTEIVVPQIRRLGEKLNLSAQLGGAVATLIDPADAMNANAANALLKTLEEPQPGRYLLLVVDRVTRLPVTIRSRCHRLELRVPPHEEALQWLLAQGHDRSAAEAALRRADGAPGLALRLLEPKVQALAVQVGSDLAALLRERAAPMTVARTWIEADADLALRLAATAVRDIGRGGATVDPALSGLTDRADFPKLAAWFDDANRTRALLDAPLRAELLLAELLGRWREAATR